MAAQAPTRGVADAQLLDRTRIMQSTLFQILPCLGVAMELLLIEDGNLLEHRRRIDWSSLVLLQVGEALVEGQPTRQLDKTQQIAALTATVAVEEIFASVDIEGGAGLWV